MNNSGIYGINCLKTLKDSFGIIVSSVLFTGAGDAIVMLNNSYNIEHSFLGFDHGLNLVIRDCLVY